MQSFIISVLDILFKPFYSALIFFPFTLKAGRHALYKQMQYFHFKLTKARRGMARVSKISVAKNCSFEMKLNPCVDFHQFHLAVAGFYEKDISEKIAPEFETADIFIDVGAYLGYYSIMAATVSPHIQVYAYEPQKEAYDILRQNIVLNNATIHIYNIALGSRDEKGTLYIDRFPERSSLMADTASKGYCYETSVKKLDDLLDIKNKKLVIKIDTEGFEFEVLKGMAKILQQNNCTIFFEYNFHKYQQMYGVGCVMGIKKFFVDLFYDVYVINTRSDLQLYTFPQKETHQQNMLAIKKG